MRAETLAGFINGLFLLFISFFIFSEVNINEEINYLRMRLRFSLEQAVERLVEPPEVKHERLLVVSILGFLVSSQLYNSVK